MKKDYIQNRLAEVYFSEEKPRSKRKKSSSKKYSVLIIILIASLLILSTALIKTTISGARKFDPLKSGVSVASNLMPVRINYNFNSPFYDKNDFYLELSGIDISSYNILELYLKCDPKNGANSSALKVVLENQRNEIGSFYIKGVSNQWQHYQIPLEEFSDLNDRTTLTRVSFILESWNNPDSEEGVLLIDKLRFSSKPH